MRVGAEGGKRRRERGEREKGGRREKVYDVLFYSSGL